MQDFDEDVPLFMARFLGHVCGVIFIGLLILSMWMFYKLSLNPSLSGLSILLGTWSIAYFFGRTAFKLNARSRTAIFSRRLLFAIQLIVVLLAILIIVSAMQKFRNGEIDIVELMITVLLAGTCGLLSLQFRKYIKSHYRA